MSSKDVLSRSEAPHNINRTVLMLSVMAQEAAALLVLR